MAQSTVTAVRPSEAQSLIGIHSRVGCVGREYEVVGIVDDATVMICLKAWDEHFRYPIAEVRQDIAGNCTKERFAPLVGQYRSIGPDGPNYEVVSIESSKTAKIWIVANEDNDDYDIEDILLDPIIVDD